MITLISNYIEHDHEEETSVSRTTEDEVSNVASENAISGSNQKVAGFAVIASTVLAVTFL